MNFEEDGECQFCECGGAECTRDNCSGPCNGLPACVASDCHGTVVDGECIECHLAGDAMTLATFRAGAVRVEWSEAVIECDEVGQLYDEPGEKPDAVWFYPGRTWLVEIDGAFELVLGHSEWKGTREAVDVHLHAWGVRECNLREPVDLDGEDACAHVPERRKPDGRGRGTWTCVDCGHYGADESVPQRMPELRTPDAIALDQIAELLSGREWSPDDLDRVANIVRGTGREVLDTGERHERGVA